MLSTQTSATNLLTTNPLNPNAFQPGTPQTSPLSLGPLLMTGASQARHTFTVTNTNDSGKGSLRDAILDANADSAATPTALDVIDFKLGTGAHTIQLTSGNLDITAKNLTINGTGANTLTISGDHKFRDFKIQSGAAVTLSGLTIANGFSATTGGGGILNNGTLTLNNSALTNDKTASGNGGGILNFGVLLASGDRFTSNTAGNVGGGIFNVGIANIDSSAFTGNQATNGGAIDNAGRLAITNSSFTNHRGVQGAAIFNDDAHGVIVTTQGLTFAGNVASGANGTALNNNDTFGTLSGANAPSSPNNFQIANFPADTFTQLLGINNAGTIAGYHGAGTTPQNPNKGFTLTFPSNFVDENFPGSAQTQVVGINNLGNTGGFYVDTAGTTHGFLDTQGVFTTVDAPKTAFNQILGVNDYGVAVGYSSIDPTGVTKQQAYIDDHGAFTDLTALLPKGTGNTQATGINDKGLVSGFYVDAAGVNHGFEVSFANPAKPQLITVDVPFQGATSTQVLGINNFGQLSGVYTDAAGNSHGFVETNGRFQTIDAPGGVGTTTVNGINDRGQVAGFFVDTAGNTEGFAAVAGSNTQPVKYAFQTVVSASDPTFTQLLGINTAGTIAGYYGAGTTPQNPNKGFTLTLPNHFTSENFPNSVQTQVVGINNLGNTGGFYVDAADITHGFLDTQGVFTSVNAPKTAFNQILGLNDNGVAAGYSSTDPAGQVGQMAYIDDHGTFTYFTNLFAKGTGNTQATGINDSNLVVGFYVDGQGVNHGFEINDADPSKPQLFTIDVPNSTSTQVLGINNFGQLSGVYTDAAGNSHGFVDTNGQFQSIDDPNGVGTTLVNGINDKGQVVGFFVDGNGNTDGFEASPA